MCLPTPSSTPGGFESPKTGHRADEESEADVSATRAACGVTAAAVVTLLVVCGGTAVSAAEDLSTSPPDEIPVLGTFAHPYFGRSADPEHSGHAEVVSSADTVARNIDGGVGTRLAGAEGFCLSNDVDEPTIGGEWRAD